MTRTHRYSWLTEVTSWEDCAAICQGDLGCTNFAYGKRNLASHEKCYTGATSSGSTYYPGVYESAVKLRPAAERNCSFRLLEGQYFSSRGDILRFVTAMTEEQCKAACEWSEDCVAAVFGGPFNQCFASRSVGSLIPDSYNSFVRQECRQAPAYTSRKRCAWDRTEDSVYALAQGLMGVEVPVGSEAECRSMCLSVPDCFFYAFVRRPPGPDHGCLTYKGTGDSYAVDDKPRSTSYVWTTVTLAACPGEEGGEAKSHCTYRKRPDGAPIGRTDVMRRVFVAGPRHCARGGSFEMCDALGSRCVLYQLGALAGGLRECVLTTDGGSSWQTLTTGDTYHKEACHPPQGATAQPCRFRRRSAGFYDGSTELAASVVVADEEACQDLCLSEGEACAGYDYKVDEPSTTCALLSSLAASWTADSASGLRVAGLRHFCADQLDAHSYRRNASWSLAEAGSAYLARDQAVGTEWECEAMCGAFPERCGGYAFRDFEAGAGDGGARCSLYRATGDRWTPTSGGGLQVTALKEVAEAVGRQSGTLHLTLSEEDVALPSALLDTFLTEIPLMCGHACGMNKACVSFALEGGQCRLFGQGPAGNATGRLWAKRD